jgi:hypothetical protein
MRASVVFAVVLLAGQAARADDGSTHKGQFGGSIRLGLGVRGIATYENKHYCGTTDDEAEYGFASVCTGRAPFTLDLEGSWGVGRKAELTLELRIGLESDFGATPMDDGPHLFQLAPGARFFFSDTARGKAFVQPALMFDFSDYGNGTGNDLGLRGIEGYWIDMARTYGGYVYVGETLGFSRWLSASFEVGVGFQVRR